MPLLFASQGEVARRATVERVTTHATLCEYACVNMLCAYAYTEKCHLPELRPANTYYSSLYEPYMEDAS